MKNKQLRKEIIKTFNIKPCELGKTNLEFKPLPRPKGYLKFQRMMEKLARERERVIAAIYI